MYSRTYNVLIIIVASLCIGNKKALSYEIGSHSDIFKQTISLHASNLGVLGGEFQRNHETLTALAIQCLHNSNINSENWINQPENCNVALSKKGVEDYLTLINEPKSSHALLNRYTTLLEHVRWSDDPLRLIRTKTLNHASFAYYIKQFCNDDESIEAGMVPWNNGLMCTSHYGKLQLLHAMAGSKTELASETRSLIEQWAEFAFALSVSDTLWDQPYCEFWKKHKQTTFIDNQLNNRPQIFLADIMYQDSMSSEPPCKGPFNKWSYFNFITPTDKPTHYSVWNVGKTFNWACKNSWIPFFGTRICSEYVRTNDDSDSVKNAIQLSALGSIIHLIQDSFAKAHTLRGQKEYEHRKPEIILKPVMLFRSYNCQDSEKHRESDKFPTIDRKNARVMDPILAVAKLIWLHANWSELSEEDAFEVTYLLNEVMGDHTTQSVAPAVSGPEYQSVTCAKGEA